MGKKKGADPPIATLRKNLATLLDLLAQAEALFPEAQLMPKDDRKRSRGKMGLDESKRLQGVVDAMEHAPAIFASLANEDEGNDPHTLETGLIRERFERHDIYTRGAAALAKLGQRLSDKALSEGALVKPVTLAGYEIAKPVAKRDPVIRGCIAPLTDYYAGNAQAGAKTREAKKAAKKPSEG